MKVKAGYRGVRIAITVLLLGSGWAVRAYGFAGGTGAPNDPYQIAAVVDLLSIDSDPNLLSKHFVLLNDLDLDPNLPGGRVFDDAVIGRDKYGSNGHSDGFTGLFDGQGHVIRRLCLVGKAGYDAGLFGVCSGVVKDLHLEDVRVSGTPCGALVGCMNGGLIQRCSVTGAAAGVKGVGGLVGEAWIGVILGCASHATVTGGAHAGGLVGYAHQNVQILESRAGGMVTGTKSVGGLVGSAAQTTLLRCRADCSVVATGAAGGLIGDTPFSWVSVSDCYARGRVAGSVIGGLIGELGMSFHDTRVLNSYAACELVGSKDGKQDPVVGGLFGSIPVGPALEVIVSACFWDTECSRILRGAGSGPAYCGTGLTTAQMQQQATFEQARWDFGYTWAPPESDYPALQWEAAQDKND